MEYIVHRGTPLRRLPPTAIRAMRQPILFFFFLPQELWDFRNLSPLVEGEVVGGRSGVQRMQGDRVKRSNLKVVCVWLCLMESLWMVGPTAHVAPFIKFSPGPACSTECVVRARCCSKELCYPRKQQRFGTTQLTLQCGQIAEMSSLESAELQ